MTRAWKQTGGAGWPGRDPSPIGNVQGCRKSVSARRQPSPARVEIFARERTCMATPTGPEFITVPADTRRVVRELRTQLGLSRATVEKRAKVGTDYIKRL